MRVGRAKYSQVGPTAPDFRTAYSPRISHDKIVEAGRCARPGKVLTGLGWVIKWDGVCISRMGGHGGPPLQSLFNAGRPNAREKCGLGGNPDECCYPT